MKYNITNVDFVENDATLVLDDVEYYFQWTGTQLPTFADAVMYLRNDPQFVKQLTKDLYDRTRSNHQTE